MGKICIRKNKKLKVCYLDYCKDKGLCIHCTCDGKCGLGHLDRQCGQIREGNGIHCLVKGCTKDAKCLHSRRASKDIIN